MEKLLEIKNLNTSFFTHLGEVKSVRGISFELNKGEALGIVGESGSGKSVTMMSVMGLLQENGKIIDGEIIFNGVDLVKASEKEMEKIRGNKMGMIFQDPMTSLNPVLTVGEQLTEGIKKHLKMSSAEANKHAVEMLKLVGIPSPEKRMKQYPHEFSGGMRQRVMIAMAIACRPELLIADEPTTALDVTIQAQILELMKNLKDKMNTSIILITHDLGVVANLCTKINVMYGGTIIEKGNAREIFYNPKHPYTWGLLKSIPDPTKDSKEKLVPIDGYPPDLLNPPKGCPFAARCPYTMEICMEKSAPAFKIGEDHEAACWLNHPDAPKVKEEEGRSKDDATR
ncbi:oligopeptide transport system ATP-binding protein [Clostridium acetobutylicum]|uniref:Oligopeptide ABC transporter, ATPase component n=1 Tax=Clostridium acetobutylicum (strain ATCC 824 / DSM 792 / JCM 1419 / IAM 19013 / LMG 5710 / NBRC 13948 / NRRL B-527 / VKM B-1787 / 2291 / W) TaxID=272562 RepID=Q97D39_CLOAB|nr:MULTISPECIES: ABC transporter ATP-binding protein [Clostridium]AAK81564.1 Oligopeptide ABC transporter, ATPase component [Clostridium acetobutylicum ATCC 824]ADZ22686.1 Oligopeptide ABC transporter, ATPase component [Clostridium acetobutylicum EA 2018]AEI34413.1 oligopeptide ABC transporter, ATPase component [Clostridium acetobutylicum DSM 1731]AWV80762.1 ABC transporter ATP-binding protein [Clostridium acetobutylicum]KHD35487.1 peptide ABC transporter ATP-binding protein [Clostridium aceto